MEVVLKLVLFGAIHIIDGIAQVDQDKCKSCQKCMDVCPQHLIEWYLMKQIVMLDAIVMIKELLLIKNCKAGCLGCMLCTKVCPTQAITVDDFLAHIDYTKMYSL